MKALILAAGRGTRLAPLTDSIPKCMVAFNDKPIIDHELQALKHNDITDIAIVGGYLFPVLQKYLQNQSLKFFTNIDFMHTNMVATMFCAQDFMHSCIQQKQDLIISYADIIYTDTIIKKLKNFQGDLGIIIDTEWEKLWRARFADPLSDAETLKISGDTITEIGKKPQNIAEIQGQYIGLFKISHRFLPAVLELYASLDRNALYDGKDFNNMYMTSFLQILIDTYHNASPVYIHRGWTEIDSIEDLKICL
ncbi:sugar nucleotidyltransferase [Helicobacter sp. 12S02634-8]|uniref:phosphocholine cytidylyltransferase family protein n=1 Tax=Helicobacter sp. 12S02634-8 TaxID=1476199 RepID=UPI000BA6822F|nr:phosphocholine cytidylyltransferase family protein [Helicobacter sp. 12S02634-8]PAF46714.1 sugar nucleotidyltransferase [Helicobacter sp. 12S02634-8]